ncbi:tetratricopeptide repeat protein [Erythrobacter sp. JK5]|uniref:tetratricopeptide repeat protein n=1 Tax=Erythrobacter sp. JK5 TaxID=2829500 RepID=UPI0020122F1C|nr:tetratricopeptide repeat protein [Erythrobacter sp. JK5]
MRISTLALALCGMAGFALSGAPAGAQESTSRAVVQPLPSPDVERLNRALRQLARSPRDLDALIEAGNASLKLEDLDAALGFFGRAEELSAENPRVKMGMAAVYLRSGRPIEALRLFAEAEAAGASPRDVLADRGLAYDLVGDAVRAQASYRQALRENPDDSLAIRRMALSQAIVGEQRAFEETLRPLIDKREFAAFRARAFGLAILGQQERAAAITEAVMPRDLAGRITPYLAYMPRLTKAQQAAAANLGIFPRAADIGRDDPRIAGYAATGSGAVSASSSVEAGNRLEPVGQPLGRPPERVAIASQQVPSTDGASGDTATGPARVARVEPPSPASGDAAPAPGFDLARVASAATSDAPATTSPGPATERAIEPEPGFADVFAELGEGTMPATSGGRDAVDLATIQVRREAPPAPEAVTPQHPRRFWVQVATGRDREALRFDWRRIERQAPDLLGPFTPHVVTWASRTACSPGRSQAPARRDGWSTRWPKRVSILSRIPARKARRFNHLIRDWGSSPGFFAQALNKPERFSPAASARPIAKPARAKAFVAPMTHTKTSA